MKPESAARRSAAAPVDVRRDIARVLRSMDFIARSFLGGKKRKVAGARGRAGIYFDIYQQLGLAWEYLALRCRHRRGWRRASEGRDACRVCGLIRGVREPWILLPRKGPKTVGRMVRPGADRTARSKREAMLLDDSILFHGARLDVEVHDSYPSTLWKGRHGIHIAPERAVRLSDRGTEVVIYDAMVCVRDSARDRARREMKRRGPKYGGFPWELPKKLLRKFPVIFEYGEGGEFLGLTIFTLDRSRVSRRKRRRRGGA
jgi:hypothetical protein